MKEHLFTIQKKDFEVQTFRAGGKGGQHQNKTDSAVRIIHKASGAVGESRNDRSQHRNKRMALKRLIASIKFKLWVTRISHEIISGETIEQKIEKLMEAPNLKIETKDENDRWMISGNQITSPQIHTQRKD